MALSKSEKIKAIITGTTGMVGEGVLLECLESPFVEAVLVINRRPLGRSHSKLKEIIHQDFYDLSPIEDQLKGYNACYFCLGISSLGLKEPEYLKVTYTLTMHIATLLSSLNTNMTFCYVSGAGTDSSEKGAQMWARVKGKTENDLAKLPFAEFYKYRPAFMKATEGQHNIKSYYKFFSWIYPLGKALFPDGFCTLREVGQSMINIMYKDYPKQIITPNDIRLLATDNVI